MTFVSFSIRLVALPALLLAALAAHAQASGGGVRIGLPGAPAASAALEVSSTSKGLLPPRLSQAQRDAIASPAAGLLVYNTSTNLLNTWNGAQWLASLPDNTPIIFSYTGAAQTYTVPAGVTSLRVDMAGAAGWTNQVGKGWGGRVQATLAVTPGQELAIYVGQAGDVSGTRAFNGGGKGGVNGLYLGGNGGGGATDIRIGGTDLASRVLVAGGGGGGTVHAISSGNITGSSGGGLGGSLVGGTGDAGNADNQGKGGGTGGSQSAGGTGASNGTSGLGGDSRSGLGGGGGGGYYGGGTGYYYGGGGGGSSYAGPGTSTVIHTQGSQSGNGYVSLSIIPPAGAAAPYFDGSNIINLSGVILNQTAQQLKASFNISGSGTVGDDLVADANQANSGNAAHMLRLGGNSSGEGLASKRDSYYNWLGLDFYTASANRVSISRNGLIGIGTSLPDTKLDVNGNLRWAVRTCPVNQNAYTLTADDIAYSIFKVQNFAYANTITLPPAGTGQVEGQKLTIATVATSNFTISAANTDGYVTMASINSGGVHSALFVWLQGSSGNGRWVRTQ